MTNNWLTQHVSRQLGQGLAKLLLEYQSHLRLDKDFYPSLLHVLEGELSLLCTKPFLKWQDRVESNPSLLPRNIWCRNQCATIFPFTLSKCYINIYHRYLTLNKILLTFSWKFPLLNFLLQLLVNLPLYHHKQFISCLGIYILANI